MSDQIRVEDFKKLAPLVNAYELQPGKNYLIILDGKNFSYGLAHALFGRIREEHPELNIHVVASIKPKEIEVREDGTIPAKLADRMEENDKP